MSSNRVKGLGTSVKSSGLEVEPRFERMRVVTLLNEGEQQPQAVAHVPGVVFMLEQPKTSLANEAAMNARPAISGRPSCRNR